jgi:hypothetical protein
VPPLLPLNRVVLVNADGSGEVHVWVWGGSSTGWEQVAS